MGNDEKQTGDAAGSGAGTGALTIDHHNHKKTYPYAPEEPRRTISAVIVTILLIAAITALVLWLVYRPHNPRFKVVAAAVNSPTTMQFTVVTRNPNFRVSIYYDHLAVFLLYNNQAISPPLMLPPLHHDSDSTVVVSLMLPVRWLMGWGAMGIIMGRWKYLITWMHLMFINT